MKRRTQKARVTAEAEHEFVLTLGEHPEISPAAEDALFEAGCDDATLAVRSGRVYLTFARVAPSFKEAVLSAIRDVERAWPGGTVLQVDGCDLVTQAEIARRIGRTRQLVHQYVSGVRGPGGFPPPVTHGADEAPLWLWHAVARWLRQHDMISDETERRAREVAVINNVLELRNQKRIEPRLTEEVLRAVGTAAPAGR